MVSRKQKVFSIRFRKVKDIPMLGTRRTIKASSKEIAKRKFKRKFPFLNKQKITGVSEIK